MKKLTLMLAAGAVGALAVSAATRTQAGALSGAEGIRIAIDDVSAIQNVRYGRRVYRAAYVRPVYRAPIRRAVAVGTAATVAAAAYPYAYGSSYPYAYGSTSYPYSYRYAPGYSSYGSANIHEQLGDGSIQRAGGGYSDAAFGFGPTGSIADGR
jgi:hypothetical protein